MRPLQGWRYHQAQRGRLHAPLPPLLQLRSLTLPVRPASKVARMRCCSSYVCVIECFWPPRISPTQHNINHKVSKNAFYKFSSFRCMLTCRAWSQKHQILEIKITTPLQVMIVSQLLGALLSHWVSGISRESTKTALVWNLSIHGEGFAGTEYNCVTLLKTL